MQTVTEKSSPESVLVVEDEGVIALELRRRLERYGYSVPAVAATADEAVRLSAQHNPDVILMDIRLGGKKDGIEAAEEIGRRLDIPIIFVTAHADLATLERAKAVEPFGYIVKPFGTTDFRAQIEMAHYKHQMERKLRNAEANLSSILRNLTEAVIVTDAKQRITFLNPMAERLTGWTAAEALGQFVGLVLPLIATEGGTGDAISEVLERGRESVRGEYRLPIRHDPARSTLVEAVFSANAGEEGHSGCVLVLRDITEARELEKQAEQVRRMETISLMAGGLAHDFNNLLTVILGYTDRLLNDPAHSCEELRGIQKAGESAASLCRQLLTIGGKDATKPKVFDLNAVICDNTKLLQRILTPASQVAVTVCPNPLPIRADQTQIQQVLINLAVNARYAMPEGGRFTIQTSRASSGSAILLIEDTGPGMSESNREHLFEPFFSRKGAFGTSLSMTIVHSIITKSGGAIRVDSQLGVGTRFHIELPLAEGLESEAAKGKPETTHPETSSGGNVLLVEDDEPVRQLIGSQFREAGYDVLEAESAEDAFRQLPLREHTIDLLITDVMMPGMTGPELAKRLVAQSPETRVLFISGFTEDALDNDELLRQGRAEFVSKPVTPRSLIAKARSLLGSKQPSSKRKE